MKTLGKKKRWNVSRPGDSGAVARLRSELGVSDIVARLLVNRGISTPDDAHRFLHPSYDQLPDPMRLPDADRAVERLKRALNTHELISIHGDYDADGVTSAALWKRLLDKLGGRVDVHVPHRKRDGYDMRGDFVDQARSAGATLILTSDCGIQRCDEVDQARSAGIDVIITDHHEPGERLPNAVAVVNPHRADSLYPFPELAGVGVSFRLGEALCHHIGVSVQHYRRAYSDLAAIGTVADMMPLRHDNRIIVKHGLAELGETKKPGLVALMRSAGLASRQIVDADTIGFRIGPRLNAIGRMDDAMVALDLLLSRDPREAEILAERMECANNERRLEADRVLIEASEAYARGDFADSYCVVLAGENWSSGVVGIVAGRIKDRIGKPTILLSRDAESGRMGGSARSVIGFDIKQALDACSEFLEEYGGHAQAAGLRLDADNLEHFTHAIDQAARLSLVDADLRPSFQVDIEIDPQRVSLSLLEDLKCFEPWGRDNPQPLFVSRNIQIMDAKTLGKDERHLKIRGVADGIPIPDAVFWNAGDLAEHLRAGDRVDLCYTPQINVWNGRTSIQFQIQDICPSDSDDW